MQNIDQFDDPIADMLNRQWQNYLLVVENETFILLLFHNFIWSSKKTRVSENHI